MLVVVTIDHGVDFRGGYIAVVVGKAFHDHFLCFIDSNKQQKHEMQFKFIPAADDKL